MKRILFIFTMLAVVAGASAQEACNIRYCLCSAADQSVSGKFGHGIKKEPQRHHRPLQEREPGPSSLPRPQQRVCDGLHHNRRIPDKVLARHRLGGSIQRYQEKAIEIKRIKRQNGRLILFNGVIC